MLGALVPVILVVHIIVTIFLVGFILVQKNEGGMGGLGGGNASGGMAGFLSGRAQANLLTKVTKWLAVGFFCTSLVLAYADSHAGKRQPLVGGATTSAPIVPGETSGGDSGTTDTTPANTAPAEPAAPAQPAAPSGQ